MDCPYEARWESLTAINHWEKCGRKTLGDSLVRPWQGYPIPRQRGLLRSEGMGFYDVFDQILILDGTRGPCGVGCTSWWRRSFCISRVCRHKRLLTWQSRSLSPANPC